MRDPLPVAPARPPEPTPTLTVEPAAQPAAEPTPAAQPKRRIWAKIFGR